MYEIGDKVIYQGADKAAYKREGTVVSIEDKDGQPQLTVELDGGEYFTAPIDDWSRKFDNSARNAKLAVGDKVRVWQYPIRGQYGKVVKVGLMEYDVEVDGKVYPGIDYRRVVKMPAANACTSTNSVVRNAMAARGVARNSVEVEVSLMYAGRVQHAMRDAARSVSGVRMTGTNILSCPDDDAADEVVDILEQAGVPKREISLNSKRVARNANSMRFGYNVKAEIDDNGRCAIEISLTPNTKRTLEGRTWAICKRYASAVLKELSVKAHELESAIAWMDQNAQ